MLRELNALDGQISDKEAALASAKAELSSIDAQIVVQSSALRTLESAKKVLKYSLDHDLEIPTKTPKMKLPQFVEDLAPMVSEETPVSSIDTSFYKLI